MLQKVELPVAKVNLSEVPRILLVFDRQNLPRIAYSYLLLNHH